VLSVKVNAAAELHAAAASRQTARFALETEPSNW
jgi:hypothetical protein